MLEKCKLQFAEAKLIVIAKIWWTSYKKIFVKLGNRELTTWGEMKAAMKKQFEPRNFETKNSHTVESA